MTDKIEWVKLALTHKATIISLIVMLGGYSSYSGYGQWQRSQKPIEVKSEVTVNVESTSNYDIDQRVKELSNDIMEKHIKIDQINRKKHLKQDHGF